MVMQFLSWFIPGAVGALSLLWIGESLGASALATAVLLIVLEVTLSFDNAVVNAGVLRKMSQVWQQRFLTWGIAIAVFGSRALLPILIVAISTWISPLTITSIALYDPAHYGELLHSAMFVINTFGGMFLTMVAFKYFFNEKKKLHWIHTVENYLSQWGNVEAIEIMLSILILLPIAALVPSHHYEVLFSGLIGIVLFVVIHEIIAAFSSDAEHAASSGLATFVYLNLLDAAFSLDSVVGAFALTANVLVITVGLGIGAYFVRSLTVLLVRQGTLDELIYIEHGAHWAIFGLAVVMLAGLFVSVPEPITGFIGLVFLSLAYISSKRARV
jgi:hypothetical protein